MKSVGKMKMNHAKLIGAFFIALVGTLFMPIDKAYAVDYSCYYQSNGSLSGTGPATTDPGSSIYQLASSSGGTCSPTISTSSLPIGISLISTPTEYWNGSAYVADGGPCSITGVSGTPEYSKGVCTPQLVDGPDGSAPAPTKAELTTRYDDALNAPSGGKPMCSSGALVTGAAIFGVVLAGAVCEANTIAGSSQVFSYDTDGGGQSSGVNAQAFWARDTITSQGLLSSFGGAQILSADQNTGIYVGNDEIFAGSFNDTNGSSQTITPSSMTMQSGAVDPNGSQASISLNSATNSQPVVKISGTTGAGVENTSKIGVQITGSGQGTGGSAQSYESGKTKWADVLISSKSFDVTKLEQYGDTYNPELGSAIVVTDYGVQILTPTPGAGTYQNDMFANNNAGGTVVNNFGGGVGATTNNFGNANGSSELNLQAANSATTIQNGINTNALGGTGSNGLYGTGGSILSPSDTSSLNGAVLKDTKNTQVATVDSNGKISIVTAGATPTTNVQQTTAMMTVTNGIGNTHGFMVNETQATMSGGINSTSLTLGDYGATFSNSATGGPIQVHGVYDGTSEFDAVNVRQLYGAVAASMATVPTFTLERGESGIGIGTGMMGNYPAIGVSYASKNKDGSQVNLGVAAAQNVPLVVRAGVGWVW